MVDLIVFPSSYFNVNQVDEDLIEEYNAVVATGLFDVVLFGYDKWFQEKRMVLNKEIVGNHRAIYRGWMMKPEQYKRFYNCLLEKNIQLVTTPEQYENFHIFPNVYPKLVEDTAQMIIFKDGEDIDLERVKKKFSRFMVKDFVKSVKGTEFPKYFKRDVSQEEFEQWMKVFYQYRGGLYTGGICVKEYFDLVRSGEKTNEYRVFYANGNIISVSANVGQGSNVPCPPRKLTEKYIGLDSPYYTIDFAQLANGDWKIIEAGDGGVSGLSIGQNYEAYYRALYQCFA